MLKNVCIYILCTFIHNTSICTNAHVCFRCMTVWCACCLIYTLSIHRSTYLYLCILYVQRICIIWSSLFVAMSYVILYNRQNVCCTQQAFGISPPKECWKKDTTWNGAHVLRQAWMCASILVCVFVSNSHRQWLSGGHVATTWTHANVQPMVEAWFVHVRSTQSPPTLVLSQHQPMLQGEISNRALHH